MKLLQLCAGQLRIGEPLPWNVRTAAGDLLLSAGYRIDDERQRAQLLERGVFVDEADYERCRDAAERCADPAVVWAALVRDACALLHDPRSVRDFPGALADVSRRIEAVTAADPDVAGFELAHTTHVGYPVLHSMQAAYLAALVGRRLGFADAEREATVCAALTMNLAMLDLQATLCLQRQPPDDDQLAAIRSHPRRGRALLESLGVTDAAWLQAVEQHHERPDGGGYPGGTKDAALAAGVLHQADIYLAKLSARQTRPAMPAHEAARSFFLQQGGARNPVVAAIIKEMGIYPPGAYVKLANGDTAVVVRRGASADAPRVAALSNALGIAYAEPLPRDTADRQFRVLAPVAARSVMLRVDRSLLFAA